ncbi:hypothetical protein ACFCT7_12515 [Fulvivirgaceae bacterium LMO-SS25]
MDKQFIYPGEQLGYTYINKQQEADNMLYLAIVDLQSQEIVDFVFHGLEDKIVEGEINLAKNLVPGYYAMIAAKYGDQEIHYEQFWVRDQNWQALGGREIVVSEEGDFLRLRGRVTNVNTQLSVYFTTNPTLLENPIERNENGEFEFSILKDSVINRDTNLPVWAMLELVDEMDQMAIHRFPIHWPNERENTNGENIDKSWFNLSDDQILIHAPEVGEFSIESMGEIIILEDPIFPEDTLSYYRSDLPTGKLKLHYKSINADKFLTEEIWNYPQITEVKSSQKIVVQSGEELALELPELINPWVLDGNHFLSMKMGSEAYFLEEKYSGTLYLQDTLNRILDVISMRSNDPANPRANRDVMFTNGAYLLEFTTDENGGFSISQSEMNVFGLEEGRLRYKDEVTNVRLEPTYPAIEKIKAQMNIILGTIQLKIIEQEALLSNRAVEMEESLRVDERIIDLDAVVIRGQTMQDKIEEVLNDPFVVDWLNEDWVCQHGVLNGEGGVMGDHIFGCSVLIGNHLESQERLPLHIIYDYERLKRKRAVSDYTWFRRYVNYRDFEQFLIHLSKAWRPYSWDPDDYKDQIGSVKLPKQNKLLVAEDGLSISSGQKVWIPYSENLLLKLKAPNLPGTYTLEVSYWDLHHEIRSSMSYEVVVQ